MLKEPLAPYNPVPKFLCVKAVLFLSFWQGVIIAGLARLHLVHAVGGWTEENMETAIQVGLQHAIWRHTSVRSAMMY